MTQQSAWLIFWSLIAEMETELGCRNSVVPYSLQLALPLGIAHSGGSGGGDGGGGDVCPSFLHSSEYVARHPAPEILERLQTHCTETTIGAPSSMQE